MTAGRWTFFGLMAGGVLAIAGCQDDRGPVSIKSDDPDLRIVAMKRDVADHDVKDVPAMVDGLTDEDAAVRFYCIESLRKLTGNDFGYHFYEDAEQRAPAMKRWRHWQATGK